MAKTYSARIDIDTNADQAAKEFDNLSKATGKAADSANRLDASFEEIYGEMQPLTSRMGEAEDRLYELSLAGDTTSKEFQELLTKVGEYRKVQIQTDIAVDGAAKTMTEKMGSALNGMTSGFALAQGSMALFGSENEQVEKSLLKVQGALAIQQGVKGLTDAYKDLGMKARLATISTYLFGAAQKKNNKGTKKAGVLQLAYSAIVGSSTGALKLFRLALISTGIGAIVVLIGMLIANFDKLLGVFAPVIDGLYAIGDAIGITSKATEDNIAAIDKEVAALKNKEIQLQKNLKQEAKYGEDKIKNLEIDKKLATSLEEKLKIEKDLFDAKAKLIDGEKDTFLSAERIKLAGYEGRLKRNKALRADERDDIFVDQDRISNLNALIVDQFIINENLKEQIRDKNYQKFTELDTKKRALEVAYNETVKKLAEESVVAVVDNTAKKRAAYEQYAGERLAAARRIKDIENELLKEGETKEIRILETRFKRLKKDVIGNAKEKKRLRALLQEQEEQAIQAVVDKYTKIQEDKDKVAREKKEAIEKERLDNIANLVLDYYARLEKIEGEYDNSKKSKEALEIQTIRDKYFTIEQEAIENGDSIVKIAALREQQIKEIEDRYRDEKKVADDAAIEAERQAKLSEIDKVFDIAKQGAEAIQGLGDLVFASKMKDLEEGSKAYEAVAKKQFKFNKAMQLSGAVIDAGKAIIASLASAPPVTPIGIASLAMVATTSAINIAKIASTKFESPGGAPDTPDTSLGGSGETAAPEFNVVGDNGLNQVASLQQQPVQAFVVSGEVTTSQALDRNRVENATL
tara:strand:- start:2038 stop:4452 length:2415 start_codon:yes stop_codon:yes gene_type:complete